jgi:hypothetical protein
MVIVLFVWRPLICYDLGPPLRREEGWVFLWLAFSRAVILLLAFALLTDIHFDTWHVVLYLFRIKWSFTSRFTIPAYLLCVHLVFVTEAPEPISWLGNVFINVFSRKTQKVYLADSFPTNPISVNFLWNNVHAIKLTPCVFMIISLTSGNTGVCCNIRKRGGWQHFFRRRGLFTEPGFNPIHGHFTGWMLRSLLARQMHLRGGN